MTVIAADRSANTSTTTGTGTFSLDGTKLGYQSLISGCGSGSTIYYSALNVTTGEWEVGQGLLTFGSPTTLTRATVIDGSNGPGNHVAFSAGGLDVWSTAPASKLPLIDPVTGAIDIPGDLALSGAIYSTSATADVGSVAHPWRNLYMTGAASIGSIVAAVDNAADLGASASGRFRDFFLGRNATIGGTLGAGATTLASLILTAALAVTSGGNGLNTAALGDLRYGSGVNTLGALPGNTTATKKFLVQTGTGTVSAAPAWGQVLAADVQAGTLGGVFSFAGNVLAATDNAYDIGASGANRFRNLYLAGALAAANIIAGADPGGTTPIRGILNPVTDAGLTELIAALYSNTAMAAGVGATLLLGGKYTATGSFAEYGAIGAVKENATDANYAGNLVLYSRVNGGNLVEALRLKSDQSATFAGGLTVQAGTTSVQALTATSGVFTATSSVTFTSGQYAFRVQGASGGDRLRIAPQVATGGVTLDVSDAGESTTSGRPLTIVNPLILNNGATVTSGTTSLQAVTATTLTQTGTAATTFNFLAVAGSTTAAAFSSIANTTGQLRYGVESSVGGVLMTASAAYSAVLCTVGTTKLHIGTNTTIGLTLDGITQAVTIANGLTVQAGTTSLQAVTATPVLAAGAYGFQVFGASGAARDIFNAGQTGLTNGFTVQYNGTAMVYTFNSGDVVLGGATQLNFPVGVTPTTGKVGTFGVPTGDLMGFSITGVELLTLNVSTFAAAFPSGSLTVAGAIQTTGGLPTDGSIWKSATAGLVMQAVVGSVNDWQLSNPGSSIAIMRVPTATTNVVFAGAVTATTATVGGLTFTTDNAFDIGAPGASRPRSLYLAGGAQLGGTFTWNAPVPTSQFVAWLVQGNTTGSAYGRMGNTGGALLLGVEQSTGGALFIGSAAYAVVFGNQSNGAVQFATNNTVRWTMDAAAGNFVTATDNATDIGASGNNRPRTIRAATSVIVGPDIGTGVFQGTYAATYSSETAAGFYMRAGVSQAALLMGTDETNGFSYIQAMQNSTSWTTRPLFLMPNGGTTKVGGLLSIGSATVPAQAIATSNVLGTSIQLSDGTADVTRGAFRVYYEQSGAGTTNQIACVQGFANATHTSGTAIVLEGVVGVAQGSGTGGTITTMKGVMGQVGANGSTVTNGMCFDANPYSISGGAITNVFGYYCHAVTIGTHNYGLYFAGKNDAMFNGSGSALANAATDGFVHIPNMAGAPTGTPSNLATGATPLVYDTTNHKLWAYDGGGWKASPAFA